MNWTAPSAQFGFVYGCRTKQNGRVLALVSWHWEQQQITLFRLLWSGFEYFQICFPAKTFDSSAPFIWESMDGSLIRTNSYVQKNVGDSKLLGKLSTVRVGVR